MEQRPLIDTPDAPTRRPAWIVVAVVVAAAVLAAVIGVLLLDRESTGEVGDGEPTPAESVVPSARGTTEPSPTPSVPASPDPSATNSLPPTSPSPGVNWTKSAELGVGGDDLYATDVTIRDGLIVLVGTVVLDSEREPDRPAPVEGRVWLSRDGTSWESVVDPATFRDAALGDVIQAADGSFIAFGGLQPVDGEITQNVAWRSVDGRSWSRVDLGLPVSLSLRSVADGPRGTVIGGPSAGGHQLWFSADGLNWSLVADYPHFGQPGARDFQQVAAGPEGFVATGAQEDSPLHVMASSDGIEWFDAPGQAAFEAMPAVPPLAPLGGDWVATERGGGDPIEIFVSANGLDWSLAETVQPAGEGLDSASQLLSTGDRLFLETTEPFSVLGPTWTSTDGRQWVMADLPAEVEPRVAVADGSRYILAVEATDADGRRTIEIWSSPSR